MTENSTNDFMASARKAAEASKNDRKREAGTVDPYRTISQADANACIAELREMLDNGTVTVVWGDDTEEFHRNPNREVTHVKATESSKFTTIEEN